MRLLFAALALVPLTAALPAPAMAQTSNVSVGTQVVDFKGNLVGTGSGIKGEVLTVKTDRFEVALPWSSFNPNKGKLLFGMTQAELNAATEKTLADAATQMVAGMVVNGSDGVRVGLLEAVDADAATVKLDSGHRIQVPRSGVAASGGAIVIGRTAAHLQAPLPPTTEQPQ